MIAFNTLHLKLSRRLRDAVSAAVDDGLEFSSTLRTDYLNQAVNHLIFQVYHADPSLTKSWAREKLQSVMKVQAIAFSSSGVAVASDYGDMAITVTKMGSQKIFAFHPRKSELDTNVNPNLNAAFVVEADKLYVYEDGVVLNAGTGTFWYLPRITGAVGGTIALSEQFEDTVVDIAVTYALSDKNKLDQAQAFIQRANAIINQVRGM